MKLRIKGDSLRLRLTRSEVDQLATAGQVEDRIHFGAGSALTYRLSRDTKGRELNASFSAGLIDVRVPAAMAREWCATDEVTLTGVQNTGDASLRILVEKDFACLKPRENEDESDHFPHPKATQQ